MTPSPGWRARQRRRRPEQTLAVLAALVVLLQLPGPGTCQKRFTAVSHSVTDTASDPRTADAPGDVGTITAHSIEAPRPVHSSFVVDVAPTPRLNPVVDAGTTRAPPA
jgi:hypothetical protein